MALLVAGGGEVSLVHKDPPEMQVCQASLVVKGSVVPQESQDLWGHVDHRAAKGNKDFRV